MALTKLPLSRSLIWSLDRLRRSDLGILTLLFILATVFVAWVVLLFILD